MPAAVHSSHSDLVSHEWSVEMAKKTTTASQLKPGDAVEQRLVAFAEQLGRVAGTLQAKADGWMDRKTLNEQIAGVRDGAADLIKQLGVGAKKAANKVAGKKPAGKKPAGKKPATAAAPATRGRSGGTVDAPGKKHRKPGPANPDANIVVSQAEKMRAAKTMVKTHRRRGRG
jgi:hypothetical protein